MDPYRDEPLPGQESVWDYPRPAVAEYAKAHIRIEHRGLVVADTRRAVRTLETSHPPNFYIPPEDITSGMLKRCEGSSFCEWKGAAVYWDIVCGGEIIARAGWSYPSPAQPFAILRDHVAFYARPFDLCLVDGEQAIPQPGVFYGGWITPAVSGPFKGGPGTTFW